MRSALASFALVFVSAWSTAASAGPLTAHDLYRGEAVVTGVLEPERNRGMREALLGVVVKLTGDGALASDPRLEDLLARASEHAASYEYEERKKGIPIHDEQGTRDRSQFLRVNFDPVAIDAWLAGRGLQVWPAPRPRTAVWLSVSTEAGDFVVRRDGDAGYGQRAVIEETSVKRGVPVWLPPSSEDEDAEAETPPSFEALTQRSGGAGAALIGALTLTPAGYWDIDWRIYVRGVRRDRWRRGVTFDNAIRFGFDELAKASLQRE